MTSMLIAKHQGRGRVYLKKRKKKKKALWILCGKWRERKQRDYLRVICNLSRDD